MSHIWNKLKKDRNIILTVVGPIVGLPILLINFNGASATKAAYCTFVIAFLWVTEAVPIAATALLPLILFPLLGIASSDQVAMNYFNDTMILFIGSFFFAFALERWELHKKFALKFLLLMGSDNPRIILLGFMLITAFISMWINNSATTSMMAPLAMAVLNVLEEKNSTTLIPDNEKHESREDLQVSESSGIDFADNKEYVDTINFSKAVLLGVAYSSSLGGTMTLIGTGTNLVSLQQLKILFPNFPGYSFSKWFIYAFPLSSIMLMTTWLVLSVMYIWKSTLKIDKSVLTKEYEELGPLTIPQKFIIVEFIIMVVLWFTRSEISEIGFPGWGKFFNNYVSDGTVAILISVLLFFIPTNDPQKKRILDEKSFNEVNWGIVLLLGGGFGLAYALTKSGLSAFVGQKLLLLKDMPIFLILLIIDSICIFLTELTSNTAVVAITIPIIAELSITIGQNPLLLCIPTTIICSYAFMLPISTPPNAIIFATNKLKVSEMAKTGLALNIFGIIVITFGSYLLRGVWDIKLGELPDWVNKTL